MTSYHDIHSSVRARILVKVIESLVNYLLLICESFRFYLKKVRKVLIKLILKMTFSNICCVLSFYNTELG